MRKILAGLAFTLTLSSTQARAEPVSALELDSFVSSREWFECISSVSVEMAILPEDAGTIVDATLMTCKIKETIWLLDVRRNYQNEYVDDRPNANLQVIINQARQDASELALSKVLYSRYGDRYLKATAASTGTSTK